MFITGFPSWPKLRFTKACFSSSWIRSIGSDLEMNYNDTPEMWWPYIVLQIFATPIYEFMDTFLLERFVTRRNTAGEYSASNLLTRFVTRGTYLTITTFFGALLPLFGDFIALTGALAAFSLEVGIVHHMYLKVSTPSSMQLPLTYVTPHPCNTYGLNVYVANQCTSKHV